MEISEELKQKLLTAQKSEITEYHIYNKLAHRLKPDDPNKQTLEKITEDEKRHHDFWQNYTEEDVTPDKGKIRRFYLISNLVGLSFGVRLMERGETDAQVNYNEISANIPEAADIAREEDEHEGQLLEMLKEKNWTM